MFLDAVKHHTMQNTRSFPRNPYTSEKEINESTPEAHARAYKDCQSALLMLGAKQMQLLLFLVLVLVLFILVLPAAFFVFTAT